MHLELTGPPRPHDRPWFPPTPAAAPSPVIVPQRGIWGTAGVGGMNIDMAINNEGAYLRVHTQPERLDDVVKEKGILLKVWAHQPSGHTQLGSQGNLRHDVVLSLAELQVDVEGYEPEVFRSAARLISDAAFDHIFLEYSPGNLIYPLHPPSPYPPYPLPTPSSYRNGIALTHWVAAAFLGLLQVWLTGLKTIRLDLSFRRC